MSAYVLTPAAQADLADIWDYGEAQWGADRAEDYIRQIQRAMETVARDPRRGRPCGEIREAYLKFGVGSHLLFFRRRADQVEIVRILHQRMDIDRHL